MATLRLQLHELLCHFVGLSLRKYPQKNKASLVNVNPRPELDPCGARTWTHLFTCCLQSYLLVNKISTQTILLDDLCELHDANADDSVFSRETIVLDLEHQLVLLGFAFVAKEAERILLYFKNFALIFLGIKRVQVECLVELRCPVALLGFCRHLALLVREMRSDEVNLDEGLEGARGLPAEVVCGQD